MSARRLLFWCHLVVGLAVGTAVVFLAITGCMMSFQGQIIRFAERSLAVPAHLPLAAPCVSPSSFIKGVQEQTGEAPASVTFFADPQTPAQVAINTERVYLFDSCTGAVLQHSPSKVRAFFSRLKDLHRWVAFGGSKHESLRAIKDAANLAFGFLVLSGLILWIPRRWRAANLRTAFTVRNQLRGRARDWNLHNVAGVWLAIPLLTISLTGTIMAYGWANDLLYRAAGSPTPKAAEERQATPAATDLSFLDPLVVAAKALDPAWNSLMVRVPREADKNVSFTIDDSLDNQPRSRNLLTLSRKGKVVRWEPFGALPRGRRWRLYARFLHSGELFGAPGQAVALIATLAALLLVWTGFALSIRRFLAWRHRRARAGTRNTLTEQYEMARR